MCGFQRKRGPGTECLDARRMTEATSAPELKPGRGGARPGSGSKASRSGQAIRDQHRHRQAAAVSVALELVLMA